MAGSARFVMMSVLEGFDGVVRAGRSVRSIDKLGECLRRFMPCEGVDWMPRDGEGEVPCESLGDGDWDMSTDIACSSC